MLFKTLFCSYQFLIDLFFRKTDISLGRSLLFNFSLYPFVVLWNDENDQETIIVTFIAFNFRGEFFEFSIQSGNVSIVRSSISLIIVTVYRKQLCKQAEQYGNKRLIYSRCNIRDIRLILAILFLQFFFAQTMTLVLQDQAVH